MTMHLMGFIDKADLPSTLVETCARQKIIAEFIDLGSPLWFAQITKGFFVPDEMQMFELWDEKGGNLEFFQKCGKNIFSILQQLKNERNLRQISFLYFWPADNYIDCYKMPIESMTLEYIEKLSYNFCLKINFLTPAFFAAEEQLPRGLRSKYAKKR